MASLPDFRFAALCVAGASMPWSKAGLSIGMGLLVLASLLRWRPAGTFRSPVGWASLALLLPMLASALTSEDLARGWGEWTSFWPLLFVFLGAAAIRDATRPTLFLYVVLISTTAGAAGAIVHLVEQFLAYGSLRRWFIPSTNIWLYTLSVCTGATISLVLMLRQKRARGRIGLATAMLANLAAALISRRRMLVLITSGLLAGIVTAMGAKRNPVRSVAVLAGTMLVLLTIAAIADPRLRELTNPVKVFQDEPSRPLMWQFAIAQFQEHPLLGTGLGDIRAELHAHAAQVEAEYALRNQGLPKAEQLHVNLHHKHCHSNFLHTLAVAGLPGLIGVLVWLFALPTLLIRGWRRDRSAVLLGLAAWTLLFLGGITDASLFSSSRLSAFTLIYGFAWGMLLRGAPESGRPEPPKSDAALH